MIRPGAVSTFCVAVASCAHPNPPVSTASPSPPAAIHARPDASTEPSDAAIADAVDDGIDRDTRSLTIREIDFCNHGYGPPIPALVHCEATELVSHEANGPPHSQRTYRFVSVTYGDMNGDGREDALVLLEETERPLLIQRTPTIRPEPVLALFDVRGSDLYAYPMTLPGPDPVVRVAIENRTALIVRRVRMRECTERWALEGESLTRRTGC